MFKGLAGRIIVDVFITGHPQYDEMKRRCSVIEDSDGTKLSFISAEDLCIHKLLYGRDKDIVDLERLIARNHNMDLTYVRSWLTKMVPAGDRRFDLLDDLERRFASRG